MVPHATATYATYTRIAPAAERCGALTRRPATACRGDFHRRTRRAPPPRHRNRWAATALRGRTPGLPLRGVRPRRWRCGCRARMALSDRAAGVLRPASRPASRLVHRPEPTGATSPMRPLVVDHAGRPSRLRSSTASRTARRARRASPCSRCRCRSRPAIWKWQLKKGPLRPREKGPHGNIKRTP